ncbi:MAG: hypothetical protein HY329_20035 [Chloroflexi bacterium]|nr:hypothetical protein [Chloroflexota bacterium]
MPDVRIEPIEHLPGRLRSYLYRERREIVAGILAKILLALTGTHIEGEEIWCCVLLPTPGTEPELGELGAVLSVPATFPRSLVAPWLSAPGQNGAQHIRVLRSSLGRIGDTTELVAVLSNTGAITSLLLLRDTLSPEQVSHLGDVVWIRPKGALWVYRDGEARCQALRLRDGTGWTVRDYTEEQRAFGQLFGAVLPSPETRALVLRALWLASQEGHGSTLVLLECDFDEYHRIRSATPSPVQSTFELQSPVPIAAPRELLRLAMGDGMTLLDRTGAIVDAGVYLDAPGGRHSSARHVVRSLQWVAGAVVVSQDGAISWFGRGGYQSVGGDLVRYL